MSQSTVVLFITFRCDKYDVVSDLANKFLVAPGTKISPTVRAFLEDLASREGENIHPGTIGGLHCWGGVCGAVDPESIVQTLLPFFGYVLMKSELGGEGAAGLPSPQSHIVIQYQTQSPSEAPTTGVYELWLDLSKQGPEDIKDEYLAVKHHRDLPFVV